MFQLPFEDCISQQMVTELVVLYTDPRDVGAESWFHNFKVNRPLFFGT